ncbi:uncharacterized protein V6R79_019118 [Siganus canaliculatus]
MTKTNASRRSKRISKAVPSEDVEEKDSPEEQMDSSSEPADRKEEDVPAESTEMRPEEENPDEHDSQTDAVIEVKGSKTTVTVSWDEKNGDGDKDQAENLTNGQTKESDEPSSADTVASTEDAPSERTEANVQEELQESKESQMDTAAGDDDNTPTVTVTEEKTEDGESEDVKEEAVGRKQKKSKVKGKRKTDSTAQTSPSKKTKLAGDDVLCLFVGNLNKSKTAEELEGALANYFMKQSVLVQAIRLDHTKKCAHMDLASQFDMTKALTFNGEMIFDKPMKINRVNTKNEKKVKTKVSTEDNKVAQDDKCLFLKNVPFKATKQDIMKIFRKAVDVRFPGGAESPTQGVAFVEFKNKMIAKKVQQKQRIAKIQDRVLIIDVVGEGRNEPKAANADDEKKKPKPAPPPSKILFVGNLSFQVKETKLKNIFQKAVRVKIPKSKGKPRGFALIEFASIAEAEKALKASQNIKILKREVRVQFSELQEVVEKGQVVSESLIVTGLPKKTSGETLKSAFEGALSARVILDKETRVSKGYGFVDFESAETCKAVKEAMEDCEIDGSKVTLAYAMSKGDKDSSRGKGGPAESPAARPAGRTAARKKGKGKAGKQKGQGPGPGKQKGAVKKVANKN